MIDQPRAPRARPKQIRGRSCCSPGAQASTAFGPAREVLLRHARLAAFPAHPEVVQKGEDDIADDGLEPERREQAVERSVRGWLVEAVERDAELRRELPHSRYVS